MKTQKRARKKKPELEMDKLIAIVKATDGNCYQVILSEEETNSLAFILTQLCGGTIKLNSKVLDGMDIGDRRKKVKA